MRIFFGAFSPPEDGRFPEQRKRRIPEPRGGEFPSSAEMTEGRKSGGFESEWLGGLVTLTPKFP